MSDTRTVDAGTLSAAVRTLTAISWPVPVDDVARVVADLGWTVVAGTEGEFLKADTGWGLSRSIADLSSDDGALTTISFRVTDVVSAETPWRADFINDAFATSVTTVGAELGAPTTRRRKPTPQVAWELSNGGRLTVSGIESSVSVVVVSAEYAEVLRELGD